MDGIRLSFVFIPSIVDVKLARLSRLYLSDLFHWRFIGTWIIDSHMRSRYDRSFCWVSFTIPQFSCSLVVRYIRIRMSDVWLVHGLSIHTWVLGMTVPSVECRKSSMTKLHVMFSCRCRVETWSIITPISLWVFQKARQLKSHGLVVFFSSILLLEKRLHSEEFKHLPAHFQTFLHKAILTYRKKQVCIFVPPRVFLRSRLM